MPIESRGDDRLCRRSSERDVHCPPHRREHEQREAKGHEPDRAASTPTHCRACEGGKHPHDDRPQVEQRGELRIGLKERKDHWFLSPIPSRRGPRISTWRRANVECSIVFRLAECPGGPCRVPHGMSVAGSTVGGPRWRGYGPPPSPS